MSREELINEVANDIDGRDIKKQKNKETLHTITAWTPSRHLLAQR